MILNASNEDLDPKAKVLDHLRANKYKRVLDVGGSMCSWADEWVTHYTDINPTPSGKRCFAGDISADPIWRQILADVVLYGQFDFCICTQTLEDIRNPQLALKWMQDVAVRGYIDVPNKWMELRKGTEHRHQEDWDGLRLYGAYRGYMHHRWIFSIQDGTLVLFPKLNFLDQVRAIDDIIPPPDWTFRALSFWWEEKIPFRTWNNDFVGPSPQYVIESYVEEIPKGL
jgi:hypothetical protein